MAIKNEDYLNLARLALANDKTRLIGHLEGINENEKVSVELKNKIKLLLKTIPVQQISANINEKHAFQVLETKSLDDVLLSDKNKEKVVEFMDEFQYKEEFLKHGLPVSNKLFLSGAPGNGKTTLANAIATKLEIPLFVFNISSLFSSYMGETSSRISEVFKKLSNINCVLFIDEMDAMFSHRSSGNSRQGGSGDTQGANLENIKIVSTLLLEIDKMPQNMILITATNNESLVDHAVKRRFNFFIEIDDPSMKDKEKYLTLLSKKYNDLPIMEIVEKNKEQILSEKNIALIENAILKEIKKYIISQVKNK